MSDAAQVSDALDALDDSLAQMHKARDARVQMLRDISRLRESCQFSLNCRKRFEEPIHDLERFVTSLDRILTDHGESLVSAEQGADANGSIDALAAAEAWRAPGHRTGLPAESISDG